MKFVQRKLKTTILLTVLGVNFLALNVASNTTPAPTLNAIKRKHQLEPQIKSSKDVNDSLEEQDNLKSIQSILAQLVSHTDDMRNKLKQHMDSTQNSLKQLSLDVRKMKLNQMPLGDNHLLTAINPRLSHRNRLKECLRAIPTNTDYNNSLTISFPDSDKEEMDKLLTLYNLRACILEHSLEWWLRQILDKAGISGIPKATLFDQWKLKPRHYYDSGEEFNTFGNPNPLCFNLEKLKRKTSLILLFPGSCVRLYSNPNCLGENRIFASDRNNTLVLSNEVDGFDKRSESIGKCFP